MKPPYFEITAKCDSRRCCGMKFTKDKKQKIYLSSAGTIEPVKNLVCPVCNCWAKVIFIEEVFI